MLHIKPGCGSVLNSKGEVEMDAIVMDGRTLASGAVSAVRSIANPIQLARLVMEKVSYYILFKCIFQKVIVKRKNITKINNGF